VVARRGHKLPTVPLGESATCGSDSSPVPSAIPTASSAPSPRASGVGARPVAEIPERAPDGRCLQTDRRDSIREIRRTAGVLEGCGDRGQYRGHSCRRREFASLRPSDTAKCPFPAAPARTRPARAPRIGGQNIVLPRRMVRHYGDRERSGPGASIERGKGPRAAPVSSRATSSSASPAAVGRAFATAAC